MSLKEVEAFQNLPQIENFEELFIHNIPMIDVRAPVEYQQGAFPHTCNLPLMDDADREAIGIRYKEAGQDEAILLGKERVQDDIKDQRVDLWQQFVEKNPHGVLYCFRGGLRSKISQHWIYERTGIHYPRVTGGYKAMRQYLLHTIEAMPQTMRNIVIGGRTGSGKTLLLDRMQHKIDLEAIFHHRGSAFGKHATPQPSQIDIENALAITWLKLKNQNITQVVLEDEAANIGSRRIPDPLVHNLKQSPLVLVVETLETRIENVYQDYIINALREHQWTLGEEKGMQQWADGLRSSLQKIQKRLGGKRYKELVNILEDALQRHCKEGQAEHHKTLIGHLLVDYYDPMYDYQLSKKSSRVIFQGEPDSIIEYLERQHHII